MKETGNRLLDLECAFAMEITSFCKTVVFCEYVFFLLLLKC